MSFPFEVEDEEDTAVDVEQKTPVEYEIDFKTGQLTGKIVSGAEAIRVWIWLALNTIRYRYVIFSWDYGSEIENLIGRSYSEEYLNSEIPELIRDCLLVNKDITDIKDVNITMQADKISGSFIAITNYGEVEVNV